MMQELTAKRAIALFELLKGALVLIAFLAFHDEKLSYLAKSLNPHTLSFISELAGVYVLLRCIEAYGLWKNARWGSLVAVISISAYIPVEIIEFIKNPDILKSLIIIFNLLLLFYLWRGLKRNEVKRVQDF